MMRRRTAAGIAALAGITAALVLGGVTSAQAAVDVTSLENGGTYTWDADGLVVSGTTDDLATPVQVIDDATDTTLCTDNTVGSTDWECTVSLAPRDAAYDILVDQGGQTDAAAIFIALPDPVVTGPSTVPAGGTAAFTGVDGYPGATIDVDVTDPPSTGLGCSAIVGTGGAWNCDIPFDAELPPGGTVTTSVIQTAAGVTDAPTVNHQFTVDATFSITSPVDGDNLVWTGDDDVVITGTTTDTSNPIEVYLDGEDTICTIATPTADWTCPAVSIPPGARFLVAQQYLQTDASVDFDVRLPAPDVDQSSYRHVWGTQYANFSGGSTYEGATIRVVVELGDSVTEECQDDDEGSGWACQVDLAGYDLGTYNVYIRQEIVDESTSYSVTYPLEIVQPAIDCAFVPAGATITSPGVVDKSVYRLTPWSGGGASSGGDGGDGGYTLGPQGSCSGSTGYQDPSVTTWDDALVQDCGQGNCVLSGLAAGIYEVYYTANLDPDGEEYFDYLFRIPETPATTAVISTTNSVLMRGTGTAGDALRIVRTNGATLCSTAVTGAGTWACQFPRSSAASARVIATDPQSGGLSAYSASRAIPVVIPVAVIVPEEPVALVNWFLEFGGNLMDLKPGDSFTLNVSGMPEGTEIEVWMHSTPRLIGTATGTGAPMALELTVPADIESGPHEIEMIGVTPLGTQYFFTSDAMVTGGTLPTEAVKDEPVLDEREDGGAGDRTDPAAPSALSEGLAPLSAIVANPATIAIAGGLALALLFLVALPTELLNSSLSSNTSRLGRVYGAIDAGLTRAQDWLIGVTRSRAVAAGILVVLIAIIYGFVDPDFGFDIVSLRLVLSLGIALFVLTFVASWISGMIIRRAWGAIGVVSMQPSIILFAVVGVVVARILEFSPGFLIGVAIGLELLQASKTVTAKAVFVQLGVVTGLALAAWVVYSFFTPGDDFAGMLVEDTMVAVTAEGLTGALIAVFPLKFLDGRELWEVSKRLWVAAFLIVSTAFALLVLPTAIEGTDVADYGVWLLVFAVFGLISLAVWIIFVRADKKAAAAEPEKVDA